MARPIRFMLAMLLALPPVAAGQAQDKPVDRFRPDGPWALDFGDDYCRLGRNFSDGEQTLSFALERRAPGAFAKGIVIGDSLRPYRRTMTIGVALLPEGAERELTVFNSEADGRKYLEFDGLSFAAPPQPPTPGAPAPGAPPPAYDPAAELAFARQITGLRLDSGMTRTVEIATGNLAAPMEALQGCIDDLVSGWGLDAAAHRQLASPALPQGEMAEWLAPGTIPRSAFADPGFARSSLRLMIGASGAISQCLAHAPGLDAAMVAQICQALQANGRYTPARQHDGTAIASFHIVPIAMLMPRMGRR